MVVSRGRLSAGSASASSIRQSGNNYRNPSGSSGFRHMSTSSSPVVGNTTMLGIGDYFLVENARFIRTNNPANPDEEPVPTISNNLATSTVMNGSYISEFNSNAIRGPAARRPASESWRTRLAIIPVRKIRGKTIEGIV